MPEQPVREKLYVTYVTSGAVSWKPRLERVKMKRMYVLAEAWMQGKLGAYYSCLCFFWMVVLLSVF